MWMPSQKLVDAAIATAKVAIETLGRSPAPTERREAMLEALDGIGTLVLLGRDYEARRFASGLDAGEAVHAIAALDHEALVEDVDDVLALAPRLSTADGPERLELFEEIRRVFAERDRVEVLVAGAHAVGGQLELPVDVEAAMLEFSETLAPALWRLAPLGELRPDAVAWMHPEHRNRFWWWNRGRDVPSSALEDLSGAALLITRFPEARSELERLISAQHALDEALRPGNVATEATQGETSATDGWLTLAGTKHLAHLKVIEGERSYQIGTLEVGDLDEAIRRTPNAVLELSLAEGQFKCSLSSLADLRKRHGRPLELAALHLVKSAPPPSQEALVPIFQAELGGRTVTLCSLDGFVYVTLG